jgi:hypothetical protein
MHHDPPIDLLRQASSHIKHRALYYFARIIVMILFGSIIFSPGWLKVLLQTPILLAFTIFSTVVLALALLADLLLERQRSMGSLIFKYFFLTLSVILAFGLFFYINATILQPPGLHYGFKEMSAQETGHVLENDVFYFSATTYYTIGYGDIVPLGNNARTAAVGEAFFGSLINLIVLAMAFQNLNKKEGEQ